MANPKPTNWVKHRATCGVGEIFAALATIVDRDVAEFNDLSASKRSHRTFSFELQQDGERTYVRVEDDGPPDQKRAVNFEMFSRGIYMNGAGKSVMGEVKWDLAHRRCRLHIDDQACELWEVSQRMLEPLFFPSPGSS